MPHVHVSSSQCVYVHSCLYQGTANRFCKALTSIQTSTFSGCVQVAWLASSYVLSHEGRQVLGRMPVPMYRSYLVDLKVYYCLCYCFSRVCTCYVHSHGHSNIWQNICKMSKVHMHSHAQCAAAKRVWFITSQLLLNFLDWHCWR